MKTAISIPDETFARAERQAAAQGVSRSEFFTQAVRRYLDQLEAESLTSRINFAMDLVWIDPGTPPDPAEQGGYRGHDHPDGAW